MLLMSALLTACGGGGGGDATTTNPSTFSYELPAGFPEPAVQGDNAMSDAKVALGRELFYDLRMAINGQGSCVNCHEQRRAFTDGRAQSLGPTGDVHPRNAMALGNAVYNARQNWANPNMTSLRVQSVAVMLNEDTIELGWAGHESEMLARLRADSAYQSLFATAYPQDADPFSIDNVAKALAAFTATMITGDSAYDRFHDPRAPDPQAMSASAQRGEALFFSERLECFHCHGGFNFANSVKTAKTVLDAIEYRNNGLYNIAGVSTAYPLVTGNYPANNQGLYEFTQKPDDMGKFRPPSLRNIALTAPYMHDGSIASLREVIVSHYARGGRLIASGELAGDGTKSPYRDALMVGFSLREDELNDLLAFLDSLTDWRFVCDPRLSDPSGRVPMHEHCGAVP